MGNIILLTIEDLVIDSGLYGLVWKIQFEFIKKYLDKHSWLYASVEYNTNHNIQINVKYGKLTTSEQKYFSIMERVGDYYSSATELKDVNRVSMSFHVVSIRDGRELDTIFFNTRVKVSNRDTYVWPGKHRVTTKKYCIWKKLLIWMFPIFDYTVELLLSDWLLSYDRSNSKWYRFLSEDKEFIYQRINDKE